MNTDSHRTLLLALEHLLRLTGHVSKGFFLFRDQFNGLKKLLVERGVMSEDELAAAVRDIERDQMLQHELDDPIGQKLFELDRMIQAEVRKLKRGDPR